MAELQPHIFHQLGEAGGSFGLQSLLAQVFAQPVDLAARKAENWKAYARWDAARSTGVSSFIEHLPMAARQEAALSRVLFHERFHYWQMVSTPAMIAAHLGHLRLIEERVISEGGNPARLVTTHPIFQRQTLVESTRSLRPMLARLLAFEMLKDESLERYKANVSLTNREWMHLLVYLKLVVNETRVEFVEPPIDYFVRLPLDEHTAVAMSKKSTLLDVILRWVPGRGQWAAVPMSATSLLEAGAYVAECLLHGQLPTFPDEAEMSAEWFLYREPWTTWQRLYGDLFRNEETATRAFVASIDLALGTDWPGQARYFGDADYRDEMFSPSYRFATLLRAHRRVRSHLKDFAAQEQIAWHEYQDKVCQAMDWPKPKEVTRRLLELTAVLAAISLASYGNFRMEDVLDLVLPERPEISDQGLSDLVRTLMRTREGMGGSTPTYGLGLLEVMSRALYWRFFNPELWADPIAIPADLRVQLGYGLPVLWVNDQPFTEGGTPVIDFLRYVSLHGLSALSGIENEHIGFLFTSLREQGEMHMRLDFDNQRNPLCCGIETQGVPCDHMLAGMACPFRVKAGEMPVATRCYYVDSLRQLGLERRVPPVVEAGERWLREHPPAMPEGDDGALHSIAGPGSVMIAGAQAASAIQQMQDEWYDQVRRKEIDCPYCGERMRPSLSGLLLQCGERSRTIHPVVQWSPQDGLFQTYSAEIARELEKQGWKVSNKGIYYDMAPGDAAGL